MASKKGVLPLAVIVVAIVLLTFFAIFTFWAVKALWESGLAVTDIVDENAPGEMPYRERQQSDTVSSC